MGILGKKKYCKECKVALESTSPMDEFLGQKKRPELLPIEFEDGFYCKRCAEHKQKSTHKKAPTEKSYWSF